MNQADGLTPIEQAIVDVVRPAGSMTVGSIVSALDDESERDVKLAVTELIVNGYLREHPEFEGAYVVNGESATD